MGYEEGQMDVVRILNWVCDFASRLLSGIKSKWGLRCLQAWSKVRQYHRRSLAECSLYVQTKSYWYLILNLVRLNSKVKSTKYLINLVNSSRWKCTLSLGQKSWRFYCPIELHDFFEVLNSKCYLRWSISQMTWVWAPLYRQSNPTS